MCFLINVFLNPGASLFFALFLLSDRSATDEVISEKLIAVLPYVFLLVSALFLLLVAEPVFIKSLLD